MEVVGSEIGQKMRSAIKAKLTELGCYVDDELPDYVMVMVANKRTRSQMEDDLQLFLGDNTELFVNWLHQVLKKLQEVTVTTPLTSAEPEKSKEKTKEKKSKEKKDKGKIKKPDSLRKAKKKAKEKSNRKKDEKRAHKSKKKSKHHDMIRPNVPPLLMNMEKESEPSITDVFAGQILKNHGITIDTPNPKEEKKEDVKPVVTEIKRPILPIIDPETITTQPEPSDTEVQSATQTEESRKTSVSPVGTEDQIREITEIEAKIQGLKQKLAEQLDSMSDDDDFLNIRTEAEELMNDFAEDVFQEISSQAPLATPPETSKKSPSPLPTPKPPEPPKEPEILQQIELKLPKRPIRERLGARGETMKTPEVKEKEVDKRTESPERFTPEREPDFWPKTKSARSRLGDPPESHKRICVPDEPSNKLDSGSKRLTSKVSSLGSRPRATCASVVLVRPRPRVAAPASSLLLRAVADAHKSLLNIPPKLDPEAHQVKRALVLPMRRCVDQKILIQVPGKERRAPAHTDSSAVDVHSDGDDKSSKVPSDIDKEKFVPAVLCKTITNSEYVPSRRLERTSSRRDDTLIIETINIHNTTVDKDKKTQFIVTMDGFNPNCFLTKKLMTEGLLNDEEETPTDTKSVLKTTESVLKTKEPVLKTTESVLKTKEPVMKTTESVLKTKEPLLKTAESMLKTKESVLKTAKSVPKVTKSVLKITEKTKEKETENMKETEEFDERSGASDDFKTVNNVPKKRLSNSSEEDTNVIIKQEDNKVEKRKTVETESEETSTGASPPVKKRKASPIVFDVKKGKEIEKKKERERTESASSDNHVIVTTPTDIHKYDAVPPLSQAERKLAWCRSFPSCRYGAACAFQHPRCKFAAACTRRGCAYAHVPARAAPAPAPILASHVVPAASFKSIAPTTPALCKYHPGCANPACRYLHPKPCRYGAACANKLECNFYHVDAPGSWRYSV